MLNLNISPVSLADVPSFLAAVAATFPTSADAVVALDRMAIDAARARDIDRLMLATALADVVETGAGSSLAIARDRLARIERSAALASN